MQSLHRKGSFPPWPKTRIAGDDVADLLSPSTVSADEACNGKDLIGLVEHAVVLVQCAPGHVTRRLAGVDVVDEPTASYSLIGNTPLIVTR